MTGGSRPELLQRVAVHVRKPGEVVDDVGRKEIVHPVDLSVLPRLDELPHHLRLIRHRALLEDVSHRG
jgi:hypothetical protein